MRLSLRLMDLPRRSLVLFVFYAGVVIVCVMLLVYPRFREYLDIQKSIETLNSRISRQRQLYPLYQSLSQKLEQVLNHEAANFNDEVPSEGCRFQDVMNHLERVVSESGMRSLSINPEAGDVLNLNSDRIRLNIDARGEFSNAVKMLKRINQITCVIKMIQIIVEHDPQTSNGEIIHIKLWTYNRAKDVSDE